MKQKIFSIVAILLAALSINAQEPIAVTCAEAAAAMPEENNAETDDTYIVTGFVTSTSFAGAVSNGLQTFYMDDENGSKRTMYGYLCNLPEGEKDKPLNVGDKITVTGKIMNYDNRPEIKNGDVAILERVKIDTIETSVCDVLWSLKYSGLYSLNNQGYSDEIFVVSGRLTGQDKVSNGWHTFKMACDRDTLESYRCSGNEDLELEKGDLVAVIGRLHNFQGAIEIYSGRVELIKKSPNVDVKFLSKNPEWGIVANNDTIVNYDSMIEIGAIGNYGYHFARWDDGNSSNPRTVTIMDDITFIAEFAKNTYSITTIADSQQGYISSDSRAEYLDEVTLTANPKYGYHFTQWSDGETENPRTFVLTQDTTFTAEFASNTSGQCGDDLYWSFSDGVLVITGTGDMWNEQPWIGSKEIIKQIMFPSGITSIGSGAFSGCTGLTSIEIPNSVTSIGSNAFYNCSGLTTLMIPNSITSIGNYAFKGCTGLTSISFGNSVTNIGDQAFYNCTNLITIYNYCVRPAKLGTNAFYGVDYFGCTLYVPEGSVDMYKSNGSDWKDFFYSIEPMGAEGDEYTVTYTGKDEAIIDSESIKLHLPEAPEIEGFTFLKWVFVAGDVNDGLTVQAVYESNDPTSAPAVYTNPANPVQKLIREGNVYILRDNATYTAAGMKVE